MALLDQDTGNQLTTDSHSFTYQSGDGSTQTETGGTGGGSISITALGSYADQKYRLTSPNHLSNPVVVDTKPLVGESWIEAVPMFTDR